ncbi:MAG TPA: DUF5996 family protein [Candidatus Elarobacter sp.]
MSEPTLPPLPYQAWEPTKTTLHLWSQILGKLRLRYTAHRNHWWNATLHLTPRGFSTLRMRDGATLFSVELDLLEPAAILRSNRGPDASFPLADGVSVAAFYRRILELLQGISVDAHILPKPYGIPITTPFPQDEEHRSFDAEMARRWFEITAWSADVMEAFAAGFAGKQSPAHLFWHSFDLAMSRFNGRRAPDHAAANLVEREAYSHEVISFGFWAGDANVPAPTYYTYTAPEPALLTQEPLSLPDARWVASGAGHLGTLPYETVRTSPDPRAALLAFLRSGYEAGTRTAGWETAPFEGIVR